ncbi:MAG: SpaA isopeptide-forming pilin-related protein [Gordonibacter urolithinfaciens]
MSGIEGNPAEVWNEHQFLDDSIRGGVKTTKLDGYYQSATAQGDGTMQGATFAIKNASENPVVVGGVTYEPGKDVATITSGADGVAQTASDLLPYGTYELRETVPPEGYLLSDEVWRFEIREDGVVVEATTEQSIDNQVIRGGVKTAKLDHQSQTSVPQGSASVEGAVFAIKSVSANPVLVDGIVYEPGKDVATITSGADGVAQTASDLLPYGTYELRETVPPEGYLLSDEVWRFEIREDGKVVEATTEQAIDDQVKAAECFIIKVGTKIGDDVTEGDKADAIPLPGVEFSIYASKDFVDNGDGTYTVRDGAAPYATIVTDENGIADTSYNPRPDDQHGALPYDDYLVIETGPKPNYDPIEPFTFSAREDKKVYHFFANNTYVTAGVELVKVDAESGLPVLVAGTQLQVLDASKTPIVWHETYPEAISYDTLTVGDTGRVYLPQKLNAGSYYLREVSAPEGYLLGHADVPFTVSTTTDWDDPLVVEYANMPQKGSVKAMKVDAETGEPVPAAGIEFDLVAASDIKTGDGVVHVPAGEIAAHIVTAADGTATAEDLYLGSYRIVETLAPEGYVLNGEPVDVTLSYAGQEVAVTRAGAVVEDAPQKGVIEIVKTDEADGRAVPGAVYEVTAAADIVTPDGTVHASSGDVVATVTTGDDGKAETDELYLGDYNVRETATPDGWAIDHETHMVELSYAGQEVKVTRTVLETADAPTTFILLKKAELIDGELVDYAGSEWHVWAEDAAGEIAYDATATTGEDGSFVLERIPHGDGLAYYCQETKTGDDYILDPEVYEFSVDEEGLIAGEPAYVFLNTNYHKRIIEAHKVDQDTGEPVGKTGFGLYRWIGEGEPDPTFGGRQGFHGVFADDPDGEVDGSLWEMVAEGTTDDMGAVIFEGLEFGWYMMVEAVPNPDYAEWWESAGSTWGRYLFKADKDSDVRQTQTYGNMAISLECNVSKATIDRTSAAFQSDERAPVRVDNVGKERYRYDVAFDAGSTNVRADQYAVVDPCEFVNLGIRLDTLVTPAAYGDTDGLVNVWYRTNMTDTSAVYSTASATAGNPPNQMADGTDRIGTVGWRLWREGVAAGARTRLDVDGLGLAAGEYVTGIMLEYGSVEVGFRTLQDMSYLVYATEPLDNSNGEVVIPNSVTSHITRNWRDGQGLYDDAHDNVITRVIDTFGFASSYHGFSTGTAGNGGALTATGDRVPALEGVAMLLAAVAAVLLGIWATRREEGEGA